MQLLQNLSFLTPLPFSALPQWSKGMVTAVSDMENPLEENDNTILTNSEEDEDIPFTVDEGSD